MNLIIVELHLDPHGKFIVDESAFFQFVNCFRILLSVRNRNHNVAARCLLHGAFIKQGMTEGIASCDTLCK